MSVVVADGYRFEFEDALDAFVFDEKDKRSPHYHGLPLKGVDVIAEFENDYVFVEIKNYDDIDEFNELCASDEEDLKKRRSGFKWLKNYLKYKYRDTFLCRYAEQKVEKNIRYVCLVNFDNALNTRLQKALKPELPVGNIGARWQKAIANGCVVVNKEKWTTNFPKWKITELPVTPAPGAANGNP